MSHDSSLASSFIEKILCASLSISATTDTCVARSVSVEKTASNTALDEILPCIYNSTAQAILIRSKELTDQLVELISCTIVHEMVIWVG